MTNAEKQATELMGFGYFNSIIAARTGLTIKEVEEIRVVYNLFKKKEVRKNG